MLRLRKLLTMCAVCLLSLFLPIKGECAQDHPLCSKIRLGQPNFDTPGELNFILQYPAGPMLQGATLINGTDPDAHLNWESVHSNSNNEHHYQIVAPTHPFFDNSNSSKQPVLFLFLKYGMGANSEYFDCQISLDKIKKTYLQAHPDTKKPSNSTEFCSKVNVYDKYYTNKDFNRSHEFEIFPPDGSKLKDLTVNKIPVFKHVSVNPMDDGHYRIRIGVNPEAEPVDLLYEAAFLVGKNKTAECSWKIPKDTWKKQDAPPFDCSQVQLGSADMKRNRIRGGYDVNIDLVHDSSIRSENPVVGNSPADRHNTLPASAGKVRLVISQNRNTYPSSFSVTFLTHDNQRKECSWRFKE